MFQQNLNMVPITDATGMSTGDLQNNGANSMTIAENGAPMAADMPMAKQPALGPSATDMQQMQMMQNMVNQTDGDDEDDEGDDGEDEDLTETFANFFDDSGEYNWTAVGVVIFVLLIFIMAIAASNGSSSKM